MPVPQGSRMQWGKPLNAYDGLGLFTFHFSLFTSHVLKALLQDQKSRFPRLAASCVLHEYTSAT